MAADQLAGNGQVFTVKSKYVVVYPCLASMKKLECFPGVNECLVFFSLGGSVSEDKQMFLPVWELEGGVKNCVSY